MRIAEITEARKNPDINISITINDRFIELNHYHPNAFVHFTNIKKFSLNQKTQHKGPLAIYAFPLKYLVQQKGREIPMRNRTTDQPPNADMMFRGNARYAYVFDVDESANIVNLENIDSSQVEHYTQKMLELMPDAEVKQYSQFQYDDDAIKITDQLYINANNISWYADDKGIGSYSKMMRKLLIHAGIDGIIDYDGEIHFNEQVQALFLHPRQCNVIDLVINKSPTPSHTLNAANKFQELYNTLVSEFKTIDTDPESFVNYIKKVHSELYNPMSYDHEFHKALALMFSRSQKAKNVIAQLDSNQLSDLEENYTAAYFPIRTALQKLK